VQCPHCLHHFHPAPLVVPLGCCGGDEWNASLEECPNCRDAIIMLRRWRLNGEYIEIMVYPKGIGRAPLPTAVPDAFAADYHDAALLLDASAKASAAVSRRCLRRLLHETLGIHGPDLASELDALLASKQLPRFLVDALRTYRKLANFDAHLEKSLRPAEISDVQTGEAEWLLDTLDALFNFYFVQPAETDRRRATLLARLEAATGTPIAS
jgi:hypothetical protein